MTPEDHVEQAEKYARKAVSAYGYDEGMYNLTFGMLHMELAKWKAGNDSHDS